MNEEDVQIEISKTTYEVRSIFTEKGDKAKGELIYKYDNTGKYKTEKDLVEAGVAELPTIAIYDNILAPAKPYVKGFSGYFYDSNAVDAENAASDSAAISKISAKKTAKTVEED